MPELINFGPSKEITTVENKKIPMSERIKIESSPRMGNPGSPSQVTPSLKKVTPSLKKSLPRKAKKSDESAELIITEKPQAALKIAYALSDKVSAKRSGKITYYECLRDGKKILVACAVGHLYSLFQAEKKFPVFKLEWKPSYTKKGSEFTKQYLDVIKQLAGKASKYTMACDYDIEGEVIGMNVMRFALNQSDANRMKFSTLTKQDIENAYENQMNHIDWGLAYAGETRHYLDWLYGINLSRALMSAIKKAGSFAILSVGRVQGPALALIVKKEKEISSFKSKPYWQISLLIKNSHELLVKYGKDIFDKKELDEFKGLKGREGEAKTEKKSEKLMPPFPFDLTTLQLEAYRLYGITPSQLLQLTQSLYLEGLISYPRTSSQKLPASIGYDRILKKLSSDLTKNVSRKIPVEGNKSDPAHPSIYPTGESAELSGDLLKIYDLIVRRFVSCFCSDAVLETKSVNVIVDNKKFSARGLNIKEKGWLNIYKAKIEEKNIPDVNGKIRVKEVKIEEKETQPPHRYSEASLVSELAKRNLGTKSTRALIIETLYKRGYAVDKQIKATPLGINVIEVLEKYSPLILDEKLTRKFEKEMDAIQTSKRSETEVSGAPKILDFRAKAKIEEDKILKEAKGVLEKIAIQFTKNELKIGQELLEAQKEKRANDKIAARIMQCPKCKQGWLVVRRNKNGQQFLACDKYPECKTTFSLPPYGLIKKADKTCECGFPVLMTIRKGKRPWEFCFNMNCPKKLQKKAEEESEQSKA